MTRPRFAGDRLPLSWSLLLAVLGGVLAVLAFPRFNLWPMAILSVAVLNVSMTGQRARSGALLGFVYGLAFFVPLLQWTGIYVGAFPWLLLAVTEAVYFAAMGAALPALLRLRGGPFWAACLFVLQEAVRGRWPFGGFPWARLAFSQANSPLRWFAVVGGAPLVTFLVALSGAGLAAAVVRGYERRWRPALGGLAIVVLVPLIALLLPAVAVPSPSKPTQGATIAVIQGSTPDRGLEFNARRRQVLDNHVNQTMALADDIDAGKVARPEIVFWPENSSDIDPLQNSDAGTEIQEAANAVGAPILVGAILDGPGPTHIQNVGILWSPQTGPGETYTKRHPVPFAEYIPFRSIAQRVSSKVNLVQNDMVAGGGDGLMTTGPFPFGDVICFEVAYDGLVRSSVKAGAQMLVIQTNNATFGHTAESYQQLAMSQLRAVETQRPVVQVSTVGVSAVIDAKGNIVDRSGALFTPARLVDSISLNSTQTISTRLGVLPEVLISLCAIGAIGYVLITARRRKMIPGPISIADQTGDRSISV
ncbi:apolipoprotein N-acyltransferase [Jatrophihabitans sp. GAS493]|uniref:apolipoprotein N-acyltransferase n=1 Tax=Jatrophihabitans sp. GAS493 TaxID=1907575 RepID=UPI000BB84B63|nr:apolipoprotein N-acyltransferase [Jatrophihabitans sp. GAS493]SOD73904.1 apolipoprotein N-acyltransferase [Jatrophihabitans sp. GAS493]